LLSCNCISLFALSGYLIQYYLVLWILPLVTVVQAILRLRAIPSTGADHRLFLAAHRGAHQRRARPGSRG